MSLPDALIRTLTAPRRLLKAAMPVPPPRTSALAPTSPRQGSAA